MKAGFYPRLAASSIRKNRRLFTPFILTCTGMVMMFYIILYLAVSDVLDTLVGAGTLRQMFALGSWVIAIFAAVFLFYTNSFLIRSRKKEFGLYNILGMGKRNIARILFWEMLMIAVLSISAGLVAGIAFSKFAELGMVNIMRGAVNYDLSISVLAVKRSIQVFGMIFLLLLLNAIRQVQFASAISLLRSENTGEKPPKGNWLLGILGVLLLAVAYYLAVTTENPSAALLIFFVAVVLVIVGTYLVMIAGSVLFCRLLQKNKKYYYKANHFVSVSSMVYRMKRNGAGLASICVLATMVLVILSSTACLYFGEESAVKLRYPRDINLEFRFTDASALSDERTDSLKNSVFAELAARGVSPENRSFYRSATFYGLLEGNTVETDPAKINAADVVSSSSYYLFHFIPLADYNAIMGTSETLDDGEALLYSYRTEYGNDTISFANGASFQIKKQVDAFHGSGDSAMDLLSSIMLVVPDWENSVTGIARLADFNGDQLIRMKWICNFDTGTEPEQQIALYHELNDTFKASFQEKNGCVSVFITSQAFERDDFYALFGSLFYLGIILSLVFVLAAVLIIYYKQISEGYEDQARFEIMQKVGMTRQEIRKSINSQLLTVFFLPLLLAALHLVFAFPIIGRLLLMFQLNNRALFAATTSISFLVFALFYMIVYRLTSNAYYRIVSGAREGKES